MGRRRICSECGLPTGFPYLQLVVNGRRRLANFCLRCAEHRKLVKVESIGTRDSGTGWDPAMSDFVKHRLEFLPDRKRGPQRRGKRRRGRARSS